MAHMENNSASAPGPSSMPAPPSLNSLSLQPPSNSFLPAGMPAPQSPTPSYYNAAPQHQMHQPYAPAAQQYAPAPQANQGYYSPPPSQPQQQQQGYYPAPAPQVSNPGASRAPPLNNADPRVKDAVELCNFAISAIKVSRGAKY